MLLSDAGFVWGIFESFQRAEVSDASVCLFLMFLLIL